MVEKGTHLVTARDSDVLSALEVSDTPVLLSWYSQPSIDALWPPRNRPWVRDFAVTMKRSSAAKSIPEPYPACDNQVTRQRIPSAPCG